MSKVLEKPPEYTSEIRKSRDPEKQDRSREVRVDISKSRRHTTGPHELRIKERNPKLSSVSNYAYVNPSFVGSTNSVNYEHQTGVQIQPPVDTVYREQYCVCARWPITKKAAAIAVGLIIGAAVGLAISMTLKYSANSDFEFPLLRSRPD